MLGTLNPFEWFFGRVGDTLTFLGGLSWGELVVFFWPALFLDLPRWVFTNVSTFFKELYFSDRLEETGFAARLRGADPPLVSIVIAGLNEGGTIEKCVRSLTENTYANKEIIVVNDGSTDNMHEVCQRLTREYGIVYVRHFERAGKSAGVNHGCALARGEFILVGDADTTFDRDAIYQSLLPFADPKVGAVSANVRVRNVEASWWTRMQTIEYNLGIGLGRRFAAAVGLLSIISGAFGIFRRNVVLEVGGHDVGPGEDADITIKIRKAGWQIAFAPKAICMTDVPVGAWRFVRQRVRWDQTTIRFRIRKHRDLYSLWSYDPRTFTALLDTVFFEVVLLAGRVLYYGLLFYEQPGLILPIAFATWIFYMVGDLVQYTIALFLSDRRASDFWLLPFLPFFSFYCFLYSLVRVYAYLDELLFYSSFRDKFIPPRVQARVEV